MKIIVEWDKRKEKGNRKKHKVSFEEAATVFHDPLSLTIADPLHSEDEERFIIIGESIRRRLLIVVHTDEGNKIHIISARTATPHERRKHEAGDY